MEVFKKQLANLDKILANIRAQQKQQATLNTQMQKFDASIQKARRSAEALLDTFRRVFSVIKSIGFASLLTGAGLGVKGVMAQKEVAKATSLDLNTQQLKALKFAGGQSQVANRDFLVNLATSLKESLYTTDKAQYWASLGLDTEQMKQMDTIDLLKTFLGSVKEREGGDVGQNKNLQDILQGLSDINLGDLKNINTEEIWSNYQRGLELTDRSAEKLQDIGKGVNTIITTFDTLTDKVLSSLAPAFKTLLDSISSGVAKLYKSEDFQKLLDKISDFMSGLSGDASDYISNLTKSIPDLLRDIKITFLSILSSLGSVAKIFTAGMSDSVNDFVKKMDKQLFEAQDAKYRDLVSRIDKTTSAKEYASLAEELLSLTDSGKRLTDENRTRLWEQLESKNKQFSQDKQDKATTQKIEALQKVVIEQAKNDKNIFEKGWDSITSFFSTSETKNVENEKNITNTKNVENEKNENSFFKKTFESVKNIFSSENTKNESIKNFEEVKNITNTKNESIKNFENHKREEEKIKETQIKSQIGSQSRGMSSNQLLQPINITINNDGDLNTQTHNLTSAINVGGWQWQ